MPSTMQASSTKIRFFTCHSKACWAAKFWSALWVCLPLSPLAETRTRCRGGTDKKTPLYQPKFHCSSSQSVWCRAKRRSKSTILNSSKNSGRLSLNSSERTIAREAPLVPISFRQTSKTKLRLLDRKSCSKSFTTRNETQPSKETCRKDRCKTRTTTSSTASSNCTSGTFWRKRKPKCSCKSKQSTIRPGSSATCLWCAQRWKLSCEPTGSLIGSGKSAKSSKNRYFTLDWWNSDSSPSSASWASPGRSGTSGCRDTLLLLYSWLVAWWGREPPQQSDNSCRGGRKKMN